MLEEYPNLKKAPITEALIDIRVKLPSEFDVKGIDSIYQSIKEHATQATVNRKKVLGTNYQALKLNKIIKNAKK